MKAVFYLFLASSLFWVGYRVVAKIHAKQDYLGYLKRAADANSVDMAKSELRKAVTEIERQGLTSGYTNVLYKTPNEDVGFWYNNLKTSLQELENLPPNATALEKSNMLIKLRETLLDNSKDGDTITYPPGIYVFPNNKLVAWWGGISLALMIIFGIVAGVKNDWFD